jgi:putative transcriptional regulator
MTITRHPDDSTLMGYAAGALPDALAAVAAAHLSLCPRCRDEVAMMEMVGGALLGDLPRAALGRPAPPEPEIEGARPGMPGRGPSGEVPAPLAKMIGDRLDAVRWRWISRGLWLRRLPVLGEGRLHLFKGAPGAVVSEHGHRGSELTMVLRGTLADGTGVYRVGDVCDLDESVEHTPVAGAEGCICIVGQDHPVRWRRLIARLARPWHGL